MEATYKPLLTERDDLQQQVVMLIHSSDEFYRLSKQETDKTTRKKLYGRAIYDLHQADKLSRDLNEAQFNLEAQTDPEAVTNPVIKQKIYQPENMPYPLIWRKVRRIGYIGLGLFIFGIVSSYTFYRFGSNWGINMGRFGSYVPIVLSVIPFYAWYYIHSGVTQFFIQSSLNKIRPRK